jgi:hypothetical protein
MHQTPAALSPILCLTLTLCAPAQQTYVVDRAGGAGSHFTDLPAAEAAAVDGDTLILRAANDYTPITTSKALTILGEGNPTFGPTFSQPFQVVNLAAGRRFVMKGVVLSANPSGVGALKLDSCLGRVHLETVTASAGAGVAPAPALEIVSCQAVTLAQCALTGAPGLLCRGSTVAVNGCTLTGLGAGSATPAAFEAATIDSSYAVITNPYLTGGRGAVSVPPAPGLVVLASSVTLASNGPGFISAGANGTAPAVTGTGLLLSDPRIALLPSGGAAAVVGVSEVSARTPALVAHSAPPGGSVVLDLDAPLGDLCLLLAGRSGDPLMTPVGTFWLQPGLLIFLAAGIVDASEHFALVLPIPAELALGFPLAFQALSGPGIDLVASTPALAIAH